MRWLPGIPEDLTPRQEWAVIVVGWAWLIAEFAVALSVLLTMCHTR